MSSTIDTTAIPTGTLDLRPHPLDGRLHGRLHGRRPVLGRIPLLRGEPRRDGPQGHGAGVEHRRRQRPAGRAPRLAGLLRRGDLPRAVVRGRRRSSARATKSRSRACSRSRATARRSRSTGRSPTRSPTPGATASSASRSRARSTRTRSGSTWNAPLPEGGSMLADEVDAQGVARLRPSRERVVGDASSASPAASAPARTTRSSSASPRRSCRRASSSSVFEGLAEIPPYDAGSRGSRTGRGRRAQGRDRRGGRDPHRHARVQRLDPGRAEERARLGLPPDRRDADPQQARRRDRREHRCVRRGLGAARAEEGARADGRARARPRAPRRKGRSPARRPRRGAARAARRVMASSSPRPTWSASPRSTRDPARPDPRYARLATCA